MTESRVTFLRSAIVVLLAGAVLSGLWAAYWSVCLRLYGYKLTERILSLESAPETIGDRVSRATARVRIEDPFGRKWERKVIVVGRPAEGTETTWYEAKHVGWIIPETPVARGDFWSVWGLPTVAFASATALVFVLRLIRGPAPRLFWPIVMLALIVTGGSTAIRWTLPRALDVRRVMDLTGYQRWTPEAENREWQEPEARNNTPIQAPQPTTTAVTPPAGQEARQQ